MEIEAIVVDVDGTLLNTKRLITPETKAALIKAQEQGIKVFIATGRATNGVRGFAKTLEMHKNGGLIISNNGATVEDPLGEVVHHNATIEIPVMQRVLRHLENFDTYILLFDGEYIYSADREHAVIETNFGTENIVEMESVDCGLEIMELTSYENFDRPVNKMTIAKSVDYIQKHREKIVEPFVDEIGIEFTAPFFVDVMKKGTNKATGLEAALKKLDIPREKVVAFGDGENDLKLIQYAGVGVAMANGTKNVRKHADYITDTNDEHGIATFLEKYVF